MGFDDAAWPLAPDHLPSAAPRLLKNSSVATSTKLRPLAAMITGSPRSTPYPIQQIEALDAREIPCHQALPDVASISNIWNEDTVGQLIGALLRRGNALADARRHHRPTVDSARDEFTFFKTDLTVMQVPAILSREVAVEKDGQTDRLFHLG